MLHDFENILAFFGSDLRPGTSQDFLRKAYQQRYGLLALDSSAVSLAVDAQIPHLTVEDFVEAEAMHEALQEAYECGLQWYEAGREGFTKDGICWPELDNGAMRHFWSNIALAGKLADAFRNRGIKRFGFFRHFSPLPHVGTGASDVCPVLWEARLPGVARPAVTWEQLGIRKVIQATRRLVRKFAIHGKGSKGSGEKGGLPFPRKGIVLVIGAAEAFRFTGLITRLSRRFPGKVAVVTAKSLPIIPDTIVWKGIAPIQYGPRFPTESWMPGLAVQAISLARRPLVQRFRDAYLECLEQSKNQPWEAALRDLRFHFEFYCLYRWPLLHQRARAFWHETWSRLQPGTVLVSSVAEVSFRLAAATANQHGIPTLAIPHGGVIGPSGHCILPVSDYMLYSAVSQRQFLHWRGFPDSRLLACKGLIAENEYPVHNAPAFDSSGRLRLLALTDTTDEGTNVSKLVGLKAQFRALKILSDPPADIAGSIEIKVKIHPNFKDLPMVAAVGPDLIARVLPAASNLHSVLEETDLVVAVNYYGSALVHAMRAGKPVVYLLTVHESLARSNLNLFMLFMDGTLVTRTPEEFWQAIRSFVADDEFAGSLRSKAETFSGKHLDDRAFPELTDLIEDLARI